MATQNNATVVSTPSGIEYFRFASVKAQLKLEKVGLKSSGGALRPRLAKEFGLSPRAHHDAYIAYCIDKMNSLLAPAAS
jgi:hypothetical protein